MEVSLLESSKKEGNSGCKIVRHHSKSFPDIFLPNETVEIEQNVRLPSEKVRKAATYIGKAWEVLDGMNMLFSPLNSGRSLKYHNCSAWLSFLTDIVVMLLIILSFFTQPKWMFDAIQSGENLKMYPFWFNKNFYLGQRTVVKFEATALPIIVADLCLKRYLLQDKFWPGKATEEVTIMPFWIQCLSVLAYVVVVILTFVSGTNDYQIVSFLRILIFVCRRHMLWNLWITTFQIVYTAKDILVFQACFVVLSAWFAFCLFAGSEFMADYGEKWNAFSEVVWSYFVLLSSVNFPDIMLGIYNQFSPSSLFFLLYLILGCFFLMNLILASVVELFEISKQAALRIQKNDQLSHLQAAFSELDDEGKGYVSFSQLQRLFYEMGKLHIIKESSVRKFIYAMSQAISDVHNIDLMPTQSSQSSPPETEGQPNVLNYRHLEFVEFDQKTFEECVGLLLASIKLRPRTTQVQKFFPNIYRRKWWKQLTYFVCEMNVSETPILSTFFGNAKVFEILVDIGIIANLVTLVVYIFRCDDSSASPNTSGCNGLASTEYTFLILYDVELLLKILCYGWWRYIASPINKFDLVNILAYNGLLLPFTVILLKNALSEDFGVVGVLNMVRLFRIFRIFYSFEKSRTIIKRVVAIAYKLRTLLLLIFTYVFVMDWIGVILFGGKICYSEFEHLEDKIMTLSCSVDDDIKYAAEGYYDINFNEMFSGFVTIFVLLMVNNWDVINDAFVSVTGTKWTRLYFACNYLLGVVVVLNVIIAFVISSLVSSDQFKRRQKLVKRLAKSESFQCTEEELDQVMNMSPLDNQNKQSKKTILEWAKNPRDEEYGNFGPLVSRITDHLQNIDRSIRSRGLDHFTASS